MSLASTRLQEEQKEEKRRKALSWVFTIFILAVTAVFLILFGFKYLDPPPPPTGVMVSMGQEEGGFTQETPQQTKAQEAASSPEAEDSPETQDYEEAPETNSNPTPSNPNPNPPNDSKKQDEPKKKTVNSDYLFKKGDKNTNNGDDGKNGNKGKEDGTGTDPLGGYGLGSNGTGWYMSGRKPETKISASCKFGRSETVVVEIKVNRNGEVIATDCKIKYKKFKATTVGEPYCKCAKQAAKSVRFTPKPDAPSVQVGAVKFDFQVK